MKFTLTSLALLLGIHCLQAQNVPDERKYGNTGVYSNFMAMGTTIDNKIICAAISTDNQLLSGDMKIIKTDNTGNLLFEHTLGTPYHDEPNAIFQTSNGNYWIAGTTRLSDSTDAAYYALINPLGVSLYNFSYLSSQNYRYKDAILASNSDLIVIGDFFNGVGGHDIVIHRIDQSGNVVFQNTIALPGNQFAYSIVEQNPSTLIVATSDATQGKLMRYNAQGVFLSSQNTSQIPVQLLADNAQNLFVLFDDATLAKYNSNAAQVWLQSGYAHLYQTDGNNNLLLKSTGGQIVFLDHVNATEVWTGFSAPVQDYDQVHDVLWYNGQLVTCGNRGRAYLRFQDTITMSSSVMEYGPTSHASYFQSTASLPLQDGTMLLGGSSWTNLPARNQPLALLKIDQQLDTIWNYAHVNTTENYLLAGLSTTQDGSYLATSSRVNPLNNQPSVSTVKISNTGQFLSEQVFSISTPVSFQTKAIKWNGGHLTIMSPIDLKSKIFYFNDQGDTIWTRAYGDLSRVLLDLEPTPDGGFVACGRGRDATFTTRAMIVKFNAQGQFEWERLLNMPNDVYSRAFDIEVHPNGFYYLVSYNSSIPSDMNILVCNANGFLINSYIETASDAYHEVFRNITINNAGDIFIAKEYLRQADGDLYQTYPINRLNHQSSYVKISKYNANLQLQGSLDHAVGVAAYMNAFHSLPDGSLAYSGTGQKNGASVFFLIKTYPPLFSGIEQVVAFEHLTAYPNPVSRDATCFISLPGTMLDLRTLEVYNASGQLVNARYDLNKSSHTLSLCLLDASLGLHFVRFVDGQGRTYVSRLLITD